MGCFHSKKESSDIHPNVYRVMNIDENGAELCSGQIEITESDILLYREGRDSTLWPLHSLRRYGFEGEIFSFESGRRCETGEGIYAFRCRRASLLFHTLQQHIQLRNAIHDSVPYPVSRLTPPPQGRQTLQASVIHRSSIDNGQPDINARSTINNNNPSMLSSIGVPRPVTQASRSPSSADILEVMPLYPRPQTNGNQVTNVYQVRDFKREHNNNNQADVTTAVVVTTTAVDPPHVYSNDISRDLAMLRNTLRQETALNTMRDIEDESRFLQARCIKDNGPNNIKPTNLLSPTLSNSSEHYAQLSVEQLEAQQEKQQEKQQEAQQEAQQETQQEILQEVVRLYVNVAPRVTKVANKIENDLVPSTPIGTKQVEYCNLSVGIKPEMNTYANLTLGDMGESVENVKQMLHCNEASEHIHKFSESDTFTSMSPIEEMEVNYAILDIDCNKDSLRSTNDPLSSENQSYNSSKNESSASYSSQRSRLISQSSTEKHSGVLSSTPLTAIGYTTIDFEKTVALTSVAAGNKAEMENSHKARNNSCSFLFSGNTNFDKGRLSFN